MNITLYLNHFSLQFKIKKEFNLIFLKFKIKKKTRYPQVLLLKEKTSFLMNHKESLCLSTEILFFSQIRKYNRDGVTPEKTVNLDLP